MRRKMAARRGLCFPGDIGQQDKPIVRDPSLLKDADYIVMESTYGDRNHPHPGDTETQLADAVNDAVAAAATL